MSVCAGIRRDGWPCVVNAADGSDYCWHHDPGRSEERTKSAHRARKAGARGRGAMSKIEQLERIRKDLRSVAASVLDGKVSARQGDTIVKCLNAEARAITELSKMQDLEDLRARLDALEQEWS